MKKNAQANNFFLKFYTPVCIKGQNLNKVIDLAIFTTDFRSPFYVLFIIKPQTFNIGFVKYCLIS